LPKNKRNLNKFLPLARVGFFILTYVVDKSTTFAFCQVKNCKVLRVVDKGSTLPRKSQAFFNVSAFIDLGANHSGKVRGLRIPTYPLGIGAARPTISVRYWSC
jgi:hypothetical protein